MERRLAAILAADVVGYSRLMEQDEAGTFERLRAHRKELFEPEIEKHHGRVFKLMGDGMLAEFGSVVDAVECAVALQRGIGDRNSGVADSRRIEVRIGVNLGDVIVEGDDRYGDGVNVAARLQQLAEPGSIYVSGKVAKEVERRLVLTFEPMGEQKMKNLAEPVQVYRVVADGSPAPVRSAVKQRRQASTATIVAAAALLLLLAGGIAAWLRPWEQGPALVPSPAIQAEAPPLPDKPSVAVLPFANLSNDQEQAYFADGLAEDLMTGLSRLSGLFVIARHSAFAYKDQQLDLRKVGRELGVRYIVEGSVQRTGEQVRINIQLVDVATLAHLWAEKYDGSMSDIFALQDRVTQSVVDALALKLTSSDQQALAGQHETAVPAAYDAFLRGWDHYQRTTPADFVAAVPCFEQAISLDPSYSRAEAALALVYFRSYDQGWAGSLGMTADAAFDRAREHLELASARPTSTSHQVAGNISRDRGWYDDAIKEFQAAIALDPSDSWSYAYLAYSLIYAGRAAEAETQLEIGRRLDPHFPPLFVFYRGLAQFEQNRIAEAAVTLQEAVQRNPDDPWPFAYLAASYAYLGREKEATDAITSMNAARVRAGGAPFVMRELTNVGYASLVPPPGSPLIRGLLLLQIPTDYYSSAFDPVRLKAPEIEALFIGHRMHGRSLRDGQEYGISVAMDGTAVRSGNWGSGASGGAGTAQIDGDRFCIVLTTTTACGRIFRNPGGTRAKENEYIWFIGGWVRTFSQVE
ncbi:MAG TPA: adenylate/guanylate cyclase domain-containing protein [Candidatus Acidoferrum sp.]|nr:adenylate/guanylate cyclase domain-containing protein [Candidatus Acidoferrum sp.]